MQRLKESAEDALSIPRVVPQRGGTAFGGSGWIGLDISDAYEVTGIERTRLFAGFLGGALPAGARDDVVARGPLKARRGPQRPRAAPRRPSAAPAISSAMRSRFGSTGPGISIVPGGTTRKPNGQ